MVKISEVVQQEVTIEDLERETAYYRERKSDNIKNLLDFYRRIFVAQMKILSEIEGSPLEIEESELKKSMEEGVPAFKKGVIKIDPKGYMKALTEICEIAAPKGNLKAKLGKFLKSEKIQNQSFSNLVADLQKGDVAKLSDLGDEIGLKPETIFFVMYNAMVPFAERAAKDMQGELDISQWTKNFCPVCGSRPQIAKCRKEDGLKILQCSLCRTQWKYPRLKCAFCENEESKTLHYFLDEEDKGHRVEVCDKCKRYIKVSDERALEREVTPQIEDIITTLLDAVAQKRGYSPATQPPSEMH